MVYLRAPYSYSTIQIAQSPTLTCVLRWNPDIETGAYLAYLTYLRP